jgi:hypothetical protein
VFCNVIQLAQNPNKCRFVGGPRDLITKIRIHVVLKCIKHGIYTLVYVVDVYVSGPFPALAIRDYIQQRMHGTIEQSLGYEMSDVKK